MQARRERTLERMVPLSNALDDKMQYSGVCCHRLDVGAHRDLSADFQHESVYFHGTLEPMIKALLVVHVDDHLAFRARDREDPKWELTLAPPDESTYGHIDGHIELREHYENALNNAIKYDREPYRQSAPAGASGLSRDLHDEVQDFLEGFEKPCGFKVYQVCSTEPLTCCGSRIFLVESVETIICVQHYDYC